MSNALRKTVLIATAIALPAVVAWGVLAALRNQRARQAATAVTDHVHRHWPEEGTPHPGTREVLLLAAEHMKQGDWAAATAELAPGDCLSPVQRAAANKFFIEQAKQRQRYVAAVSVARVAEQDGADVEAVRLALKRALLAASRGDRLSVEAHLGAAHRALASLAYDETGPATVPHKEAVAGLLVRVGPSFLAGQELLLEGHTGVEKLLRRARYFYEDGDYGKTQSLIRLALQLSGMDAAAATADDVPEWFESLEPISLSPAARQTAESAVGLCESMAAASKPSEPVRRLVGNAKRELAAERFDEAYWWASVALNALGMPDKTIPREAHD
jgi:hypothetical protein